MEAAAEFSGLWRCDYGPESGDVIVGVEGGRSLEKVEMK